MNTKGVEGGKRKRIAVRGMRARVDVCAQERELKAFLLPSPFHKEKKNMLRRFENYVFPICVAILIAIGTSVVACTHFSMRIGELKDAEVVLDNGQKKE